MEHSEERCGCAGAQRNRRQPLHQERLEGSPEKDLFCDGGQSHEEKDVEITQLTKVEISSVIP